ncbi:MAG: MerR family transcriptional regulator [Chloroflexi bacterium B3_Chlor]|nr:MAG: MerR family transcriptional regulator [Chloroflexi bacterium B3_Chlor]
MENGDPLYDEPCYVISVAAKIVDLHPQTLRYYERVGVIMPHRSEGNRRLYSPRDVERLRAIIRLVDDLGVNLAGVEVIFNMRRRMEEMQKEMDRVRAEFEEETARLRALLEDMS